MTSEIIDLELSPALENTQIVEDFDFDLVNKNFVLDLNHVYNEIRIIVSYNKNWTRLKQAFQKEFDENQVKDNHGKLLLKTVNDNYNTITIALEKPKEERTEKEETREDKKDKEKPKTEFSTYKYSQRGKGNLYESAIVNGFPVFISYNNLLKEVEITEKIEENSRILRPPQLEEYPYKPYEFESKGDLEQFIEEAKKTNLDELYIKRKSIFKKYVDQEEHVIILLSTDSIWTYFQDLFPVTHYSEGVGTNDVGKSSIGYTFEYTGYRTVKAIAISGPNYYRLLGTIEPGQCTIIEDEGDNIGEDSDKIKIFKSGYEFSGKVPKINMNSREQQQKWFWTYCYKMILAEKSLSQSKAQGLIDRTFSFNCRPGKVKYSIKEIVSNNINKNPQFQKLYDELLNHRKLMLCYRLVHYKDELPNIETGLKNRDNELCKPLLQLFYGTEALKEIIKTLEIFVKQRKERKLNSLQAVIYPIIKQIIIDKNGVNSLDQLIHLKMPQEIQYSKIWHKIVTDGEIEGYYDEKKKNQYETVNYGVLHNNWFSRFIADKFGAKLTKKRDGSILTFDIPKLLQFETMYGNNDEFENDVKIRIKLLKTFNEDNEVHGYDGDSNDGGDGGDGKSMRVTYYSIVDTDNMNIINEKQEQDIDNNNTHIILTSLPSLQSLQSSYEKNEIKEIKPKTQEEYVLGIKLSKKGDIHFMNDSGK